MAQTLIWLFLITPGITILLEFPVIYFTGICRRPVYIVAVNGLTNLSLNLIALLLGSFAGFEWKAGWILFSELLLIPNAEAQLYRALSPQKLWKLYLLTYAANAISFLAGAVINFWQTGRFALLY